MELFSNPLIRVWSPAYPNHTAYGYLQYPEKTPVSRIDLFSMLICFVAVMDTCRITRLEIVSLVSRIFKYASST